MADQQEITNRRVLFVDDESNVLDSFRRTLRKRFEITTACGSPAGLDTIRDHPTFAVVVSDLKMPKQDGIAFLKQVRELSPDTVRILLTGHADVESAIAAVNDGAVFRFLTKPCQTETLIRAVEAALRQHHLVVSEREFLRGTLRGSIAVLTEVLALTNPEAFGRSERMKKHMTEIAKRCYRRDIWKLELGAMLSQIGCVTLPPDTLIKHLKGEDLTSEEQQLFDMHPNVGFDLLNHIPRMQDVAAMVQQQRTPLWQAPDMPFGARALKIMLDYDLLISKGESPVTAISILRKSGKDYDAEILATFEDVVLEDVISVNGEVYIEDLRPGMITAQNIETREGTLLAAKDQELTEASIARIRNFSRAYGVDEPIFIKEVKTKE